MPWAPPSYVRTQNTLLGTADTMHLNQKQDVRLTPLATSLRLQHHMTIQQRRGAWAAMLWPQVLSQDQHLLAMVKVGSESRGTAFVGSPSLSSFSSNPLCRERASLPFVCSCSYRICSGFSPFLFLQKLNQTWRKWSTVLNVNVSPFTLPFL